MTILKRSVHQHLWHVKGQSTQEYPRTILCFVASGNSAPVRGSAQQLLCAIKQAKNRARLLLATPQCRWALRSLYKNTSLPASLVQSLLLKLIILTQFSLVHLLQKYHLHA